MQYVRNGPNTFMLTTKIYRRHNNVIPPDFVHYFREILKVSTRCLPYHTFKLEINVWQKSFFYIFQTKL